MAANKKKEVGYISIENAEIGHRNFSGRSSEYNAAGQRNFCVFLDEELAKTLEKDGWNVRWPKDPSDETKKPLLQVSIRFDPYPPNVNMITQSKGVVKLDEYTISNLDDADIENVDIRIRPYHWTLPDGRTGIKAYVKDMYVTCQEDPFAAKYYTPDVTEDEPF